MLMLKSRKKSCGLITVMCSYSCHKCHRIHHHMPAAITSAVMVTDLGAGGGAVRYDQLQEWI